MAQLLNTIIKGVNAFISSAKFISGLMGYGWRISMINGKSKAEFDDLVIRNTMTIFELLISKVRAIRGAMGITQASGKVGSVREDENNYYLSIDEENSFVANDVIRCLEFNGEKRNYWVIISAINESNELVIPKTEFEGSATPMPGDEIVQFGNTTDTRRQSAIYLHADENGSPAIDVLDNIDSKSFEGKVKLRIGGLDEITDTAFPGGISGYGIYSQNGYFKGTISGAGGYLLRADGTGYICNGAIWWDKEKKVHFEGDVVLGWENLSDEVKENLKGDSVFITYNDSEEEPARPTLDGTADGWHLDSTTSVVWMSTKIASNIFDGEWGNPIRIKGESADTLPWIKDWNDNTVQIKGDYIVSPRIFSGINEGTPDNPLLTGVAMGRNVITEGGKPKTGIYGINKNEVMFSLDSETGTMKAKEAEIEGTITANKGKIGDFIIEDGNLSSDSLNINSHSVSYTGETGNAVLGGYISNTSVFPIEYYPLYLDNTLNSTPGMTAFGAAKMIGKNTDVRICENDIALSVVGGVCLKPRVIRTSTTLGGSIAFVLCYASSSITVGLPTTPSDGQFIVVRKCAEGNVTITGSGHGIQNGWGGTSESVLLDNAYMHIFIYSLELGFWTKNLIGY